MFDTNVLARYITQDDVGQVKQASIFLESLNENKKGYISIIVLDDLVATKTLIFEYYILVQQALAIYHNTSSDFSDLLVNSINKHHGCAYTVTFDKGVVNKANIISLSLNKE